MGLLPARLAGPDWAWLARDWTGDLHAMPRPGAIGLGRDHFGMGLGRATGLNAHRLDTRASCCALLR